MPPKTYTTNDIWHKLGYLESSTQSIRESVEQIVEKQDEQCGLIREHNLAITSLTGWKKNFENSTKRRLNVSLAVVGFVLTSINLILGYAIYGGK